MSLLVGIYNTSRLHIDNYNRATHSKLVTCAACNRTLIGKKGIKVVHHYAHEQDAKCAAIKRDSRASMHISCVKNINNMHNHSFLQVISSQPLQL